MKISILTVELQQAIKKVNTVSHKDTPFQGILLTTVANKLIVEKSNGYDKVKMFLDAEVIEDGSIFIPIKTIKLIEKLKKVTFLQVNDNFIQADKKKIKFLPLDVKKYIDTENKTSWKPNFNISEKELNRMLVVKYAMAKDETRPILKGINIKENMFCALDGYTVSLRESTEFIANYDMTITQENIKILDKLIDKKSDHEIRIYNSLDMNNVMYEVNNIEIVSRVLSGEYINYKNIIPEDHTTSIKLDVNKLAENMEFLKSIKEDTTMLVKFNIDNYKNIVTVSGSTQENKIEDELGCLITGDNLTIMFNCEFILAMLKDYKNKNITMEFTSPVNPCIIRESTDYNDYNLDMVLPVRMRDVESNVA